MSCEACGRGFHKECTTKCKKCHPVTITSEELVLSGKGITYQTGKPGRPIKEDSIQDRKSTGRKRAALLYPIDKDAPCEWRGKKNVGGGLKPITGCIIGIQTHRHHGPIKDPIHNEPGNVHRICYHCHNRWHTLNDPIYDPEKYRTLPHTPQDAEMEELIQNETWWSNKKYRTEEHDS